MNPSFRMIIFILLLLSLSSPAFPQIYKWTNKDGSIVFSDTPPPRADIKEVKIWEEKREHRNIEVILYMKEWDPPSLRARAYLKTLGVHLTEYDVKKDKSKNKERARKCGGRSGVPVIDVEGIILVGYNESQIKRAVEKRRKNIP